MSPVPRRQPSTTRAWQIALVGVAMAALTFFFVGDILFGFRDRLSRAPAYAPVGPGDTDRQAAARAIRARIDLLLKPRDGKMVLHGDRNSRLIEAGLLHGRLALLEEARGNAAMARFEMAAGVALLESAAHPDPTEEHIREVIAKQDARRAR